MDEPVLSFDLELFEELNEEYRAKPLVATPPGLDPKSRTERARAWLSAVERDLAIEGGRVLEIGTAHGQMSRELVDSFGASEAVGVDLAASPAWGELEGTGVSFLAADLSVEDAVEPGSFDIVISNSVLEHVNRPLRMIEAIARALRPGGEAWLNFNLHRGPKASHRYREVYFPWPHLLFDPAVARDYYRKHHDRENGFAWVNRLTAAEYLAAFAEAGLQVDLVRRSVTAIDLPCYRRFADLLGRYPALDLETDFLRVKLTRSDSDTPCVPAALDYLGRQRALDQAVATAAPSSS